MTTLHTDRLLDLERRGWDALCRSEGADFYGEIMTDDGLMVLAGGMVLDRDAVIRSLADAPPWASYEIDDVRLVPDGEEAAVLVYRARAVRDGQDEPFTALMSSLYRIVAGRPRLVLHQQTVLADQS